MLVTCFRVDAMVEVDNLQRGDVPGGDEEGMRSGRKRTFNRDDE